MRREDGTYQDRPLGQDIVDLVDTLFSELDKDGDGQVEFRELLRVS
jgi:Ca2+-binding EF-hand superfamily protein